MNYDNFYIAFGLILCVLAYFAGHADGYYKGADYICDHTLYVQNNEFECILDKNIELIRTNPEVQDDFKIQFN